MTRHFTHIIILILLQLVSSRGDSQVQSDNGRVKQLSEWRRQQLQEKIFVHTDKDVYVNGEIIWLKLYVMDGSSHVPLAMSKVAYIELLDRFNKPVWQTLISLKDGTGEGSIYLPSSLLSGHYKLRAYTNWMKNQDASFYFEKTLTIVNTDLAGIGNDSLVTDEYEIRFFPEGGQLLNGIEGVMAFQVVNQSGKGVSCSVSLLDTDSILGERVFSNQHGIGKFSYIPTKNHIPIAFIQLFNGQEIQRPLPMAGDEGTAIRLIDESDRLRLLAKTRGHAGEPVMLLIHSRGILKMVKSAILDNGGAEFLISADSLGDGVNHITLFDQQQQPVAERLYFHSPRKKLDISLQVQHREAGLREKVSLKIAVKNELNNFQPAELSVSVYQLDSLQGMDEMTIERYLWLGSDLQGRIESPGTYFIGTKEEQKRSMDLLMLTHGWRRFKWNDLAAGNMTPLVRHVPEYNGHLISGWIRNRQTGLPIRNRKAFLSIPGAGSGFASSVSNQQGELLFETKELSGSSGFILQSSDSTGKLTIESPFSSFYSAPVSEPFFISPTGRSGLQQRLLHTQAQQVYQPGSILKFSQERSHPPFYGKPDAKYELDQYTRFSTIDELLREYVREVTISRREGNHQLSVYNSFNQQYFAAEPLQLLDGVPVFNTNQLILFDPIRIKSVEVVTKRYYLGDQYFDGIVHFRSFDGDMGGYKLDPQTLIVNYEGIQARREFYSPVYDSVNTSSYRLPDFRSLLFWSPVLKIQQGQSGRLSFFSSDQEGKYIIVVQAISADGRPGSAYTEFEVRKK